MPKKQADRLAAALRHAETLRGPGRPAMDPSAKKAAVTVYLAPAEVEAVDRELAKRNAAAMKKSDAGAVLRPNERGKLIAQLLREALAVLSSEKHP